MDRADFGTVTSFDLFRANSGSYKIRVGYTWTSSDGDTRNQIDYISVSQR